MFVVLSFEKLCVRMNMVVSEVLNATLFPALSWTEQLAKCQFHFAGKVARAILVINCWLDTGTSLFGLQIYLPNVG